jgi:hypothetical protein
MVMFAGANTHGQQTVYRWVDKEGVVHLSDEPPDGSQATEIEKIETEPPPRVGPTQAVAKPPADDERYQEGELAQQPQIDIPASVETIDIKAMTLEELDRRCEDAREEEIAPLREAEIARCKQQERNDPAWCERFYADYGAGGKTQFGGYRPGMFHNLPECRDAEKERRERWQ